MWLPARCLLVVFFFHKKKSNCLNSSDIFLCFPDGRVKNLQKIITFLPGKTVPWSKSFHPRQRESSYITQQTIPRAWSPLNAAHVRAPFCGGQRTPGPPRAEWLPLAHPHRRRRRPRGNLLARVQTTSATSIGAVLQTPCSILGSRVHVLHGASARQWTHAPGRWGDQLNLVPARC